MKILGIESASLVASVAVVTDGLVTAEYTVDFKKTHSQTLLPMIDEVTRMLELDLHEVDAIAVSGGPGSYTGLRIGSATAKGLGLALEKPLVHVPTMDAMAYNLYGTSALICPIMDARRGQVYTGLYHYEENFAVVKPQCGMDIHELIQELNAPQITGATYAMAVPATQVKEMAVEMVSCCLESWPSSAMSALYGVQ